MEGSIKPEQWKMIENAIEQVKGRLVPEKSALIRASSILEQATDTAET